MGQCSALDRTLVKTMTHVIPYILLKKTHTCFIKVTADRSTNELSCNDLIFDQKKNERREGVRRQQELEGRLFININAQTHTTLSDAIKMSF